jgi:hypothetical protein
MRTFFSGKDDGTMPSSRWDASTRVRVIRLILEHAADYPTQLAVKAVLGQPG